MTSTRPYLIRALYQWIVDNGFSPRLLIDARDPSVIVPRDFVENGRIVLNIGPMAVKGLTLGNDDIVFSARFHGTPMQVVLPMNSVMAIYADENGQGMMFGAEDMDLDEKAPTAGASGERLDADAPQAATTTDKRPAGRPSLKIVK